MMTLNQEGKTELNFAEKSKTFIEHNCAKHLETGDQGVPET